MYDVRDLPDLDVIDGWFRKGMESGSKYLGMADTIEELAEQIGLDPAELKKTVDTYNASCAEGLDWEYFKDPAHMVPLSEGPFYALAGRMMTDGAFGGILVDETMQARKAGGGLVEGLFVTGDAASGRHIALGGMKKQVLNDMSWALSSGYIAGAAAAAAAGH